MPNWCDNTFTLKGPTEKVNKIYQHYQKEGNLLDALYPPPKDMFEGNLGEKERKECAEKGIPNWYDWQVSNWGTKWDVSLEGLEFIDNEDGTACITGWFESAWAPPIDAYNRFLDDMDNCSLEASYHEPGMDFAGFYTDGEEEHMDNLHDEYELPEELRSDLYKRLDDEYGLSDQFDQYDDDSEAWEEVELDDEA